MIQCINRLFCMLILGMLVMTFDAYSANMCIKDDVVTLVLDPLINGSSSSYDVNARTWSVSFSYGVVSGIAGCSTPGCSGYGCVPSNQNITQWSTGSACYCKMLRPVTSKWVASSSSNNCAADCPRFCGTYLVQAARADLRRGLFGSVGQ